MSLEAAMGDGEHDEADRLANRASRMLRYPTDTEVTCMSPLERAMYGAALALASIAKRMMAWDVDGLP